MLGVFLYFLLIFLFSCLLTVEVGVLCLVLFLLGFFWFVLGSSVYGDVVFVSYSLEIDLCSWVLVLLTLYLLVYMVYSMGSIMSFNYPSYQLLMLVFFFMGVVLVAAFTVSNYFVFYFFFELSLLPILWVILGWGSQPERLQAGLYMMMYTLFGSLPLLASIFYLYNQFESMYMGFYVFGGIVGGWSGFLMLFLFFAFMVKLPVYGVHLWLPKAHVEAPVGGSMVLAGILLKLGGYGLFRVLTSFGASLNVPSGIFIVVALVGGLLSSFVCFFQSDLKIIVAYSSVCHMSLIVLGLFSYYAVGFSGALLMMVAHGLSSSALFYYVTIFYDKFGSRSIYLIKGMLNYYPLLAGVSFMVCASNMAVPPSLNLLSEIWLYFCAYGGSIWYLILLGSLTFMSSVYSLFLYTSVWHGSYSESFSVFNSDSFRDLYVLLMHLIPVFLSTICVFSWVG